ncbi:MAG: ferrous iron transport protein B [Bacteroidia bacterium]|nr:ferrous iron transport protein B [Bacteroidia bacterium]
MNLSDLQNNQKGIITKVRGRGAFRKRITEMGFIKGKEVKVIKPAPLKDPVEYQLMGYEVSLRRSEAELIEIITEEEALSLQKEIIFDGTITGDLLERSARIKGNIINVALVGNPNSGKTTLFNYASGSKEHVGNYSGVTVDAKTATFKQDGYTFHIVDLPGTYSISAYSPEELFVRNYIAENVPDVVINVVDSSNLERNLYLTTQLIDMDIRVVVALNMYDELVQSGARFDFKMLGEMIGIPFVPTIGSKGRGIQQLFRKVIEVYEDKTPILRHIHINYGPVIEESVCLIQDKIRINKSLIDKMSSRFLAIKLLEKDKDVSKFIQRCVNAEQVYTTTNDQLKTIEEQLKEDSETAITDARYGFIAGALKETFSIGPKQQRRITDGIDDLLTHRVFGFPVFIFFMWVMFQVTFSLGSYPKKWIETLVALIGSLVNNLMPAGALKDLTIDGIISGVGGVIVFLPNILILFFFISLMEDTGYMARAAFIMDKIMHKIGLHGKSFIPLIMGFGCNVPAIMATRTLENRNDRLLTMLINPFMSCSARLPVYLLLIGAFFPHHQGTILFVIYLTGILIAIIAALVFKKLLFKTVEAPFVMELPPYRMPTSRSIFKHMWNRGEQYLRKIGGVILMASIIVWALGYYPRKVNYSKDYSNEIVKSEAQLAIIRDVKHQDSVNYSMKVSALKKHIHDFKSDMDSEHQANSYIGKIGKIIQPVLAPLGFDWRIGICLLMGVAGKEIVISTMSVLYQGTPGPAGNPESLTSKLKEARYTEGSRKGTPVFNPLVAFSMLMFVLIYFPCVAVIATVKKESGSLKWALFTIFYTTGLAWFVSLIVFQVGSIFH